MAGRPRKFDPDEALEKAIDVFFVKGYEGTSLDDLTKEMGINRPSLYKAFGNKEALFQTAVRTYYDRNMAGLKATLSRDPDPLKALETAMIGVAQSQSETQRGCLVVNSCNNVREEDEDNQAINLMLRTLTQDSEEIFYDHLLAAQEQGYLLESANPRELAQYFNGVMQGLALMGRLNGNPDALMSMARQSVTVLDNASSGKRTC